jgi:phosphatidylglycerophosphatase GEP4
MTLRAPVLAHRHAKPACAKDILAFFHGKTAPRTHRAQVVARLEAAERAEDSAEQILLDKWRGEVEDGPLCGALTDARTLEEKMVAAQMRKPAVSPRAPASDAPPPPPPATTAPVPPEPLRIVVVGDRLFTDTLQARELDRHLPASPVPATLSIQTTDLPQPNDVRFLRWLEDWLSGYKLAHGGRTGGVAWDTYLIPLPPVPPVPRWMDLQRAKLAPYNPITRIDAALDDGGPPITWDPRTWRPKPVARAVLRSAAEAAAYLSRLTWEGAKIAAVALWTKARAWSSHKYAQIKAERARRAEERERNEIDKEREEEKAAASAAVPEAVGPHGVAAKTKA